MKNSFKFRLIGIVLSLGLCANAFAAGKTIGEIKRLYPLALMHALDKMYDEGPSFCTIIKNKKLEYDEKKVLLALRLQDTAKSVTEGRKTLRPSPATKDKEASIQLKRSCRPVLAIYAARFTYPIVKFFSSAMVWCTAAICSSDMLPGDPFTCEEDPSSISMLEAEFCTSSYSYLLRGSSMLLAAWLTKCVVTENMVDMKKGEEFSKIKKDLEEGRGYSYDEIDAYRTLEADTTTNELLYEVLVSPLAQLFELNECSFESIARVEQLPFGSQLFYSQNELTRLSRLASETTLDESPRYLIKDELIGRMGAFSLAATKSLSSSTSSSSTSTLPTAVELIIMGLAGSIDDESDEAFFDSLVQALERRLEEHFDKEC